MEGGSEYGNFFLPVGSEGKNGKSRFFKIVIDVDQNQGFLKSI